MNIKNSVPTEWFLQMSSWFLECFLLQVMKSNTVAAKVCVKTFCLYPGEIRVEEEELS